MEKRLLSRRKVAPARTFPPILWMDVQRQFLPIFYGCRPAPTALHRRDDFDSVCKVGHRHGLSLRLAKWETVSGQFECYLTARIR
jgi:hypothetical protein